MIDCAFCDNEATEWDADLEMALCHTHHSEMNGIIPTIELDEVY